MNGNYIHRLNPTVKPALWDTGVRKALEIRNHA